MLYCSRWAETVDFYATTIGFDRSLENDWFVEFDLHDGAHLSVANADRATIAANGGDGLTLSWQVADLDAERSRLSALGVAVSAPTPRWGALTAFLHDPEGNRIELWQSTG